MAPGKVKTVLRRALEHAGRIAVAMYREHKDGAPAPAPGPPAPKRPRPDAHGCTYADVLEAAASTARELEGALPSSAAAAPREPRVGLMASPGPEYVRGMFAIWLAGGVVVPLSLSQPEPELRYVLADARVEAVLSTPELRARLEPASVPVLDLGAVPPAAAAAAGAVEAAVDAAEARLDGGSGALIIYTSGTTGRPKGALHTFASLQAQVDSMCAAWRWRPEDRILHGLPLHHIHGIVNALLCALHAGAAVEFLPRFSPTLVWAAWARPERRVTVFMGVPTMYVILLRVYDAAPEEEKPGMRAAAAALRLTVSGSAACPVGVMAQWEAVSGARLLERYGMTEIGMALSNPYEPAADRRAGAVGTPLPGVECRVRAQGGGGEGELLVRGPTLFREYVGRPRETAEAFDADGWFMTGDPGRRDAGGVYTILGRSSVDIIKSGGYKLSALEIESVLLTHPAVREVAVMGVDDEVYGEAVAAVAALEAGVPPLPLAELREWCRERMAPYKAPTVLRLVDAIPRNAMGKVNKRALRAEMFPKADDVGD